MSVVNKSIGTDNPRPAPSVTFRCYQILESSIREPLSPDHVFDFPADNPSHDFEDPHMDVEEDPEEEQDMDVEEVVPPVAAPPTVLSSITPPSLSESSSNSDYVAPVTADRTVSLSRVSDDVLTLQEDKARDREEIKRGVVEACPSESIDVLVVYGDAQHSEPQGLPDGPQRLRRKAVERLMANRVAEAIAEYKRNKTNPEGEITGGAGGNITPNGLSRCFKKMESVFEISKCAEEDKVKYAVCTLEGRALTWWNGNVNSLGIKKMEQELWTLYMKEDDIDGYTNRFHELAVICPTLGMLEYIKIECYVWGLLERIQGNVTSSKSANVHENQYRNKCLKRKDQQNERAYVMRTEEPQQKLNVVTDNLSGLPPAREVEFHIDLIPRVMSVARSPYQLEPSEMQELANQLKEFQDKGFI
uniref:Reverse transcriptase domain-containing protein n=1 Tax=Tanacetum cinerariifolium TaxID=118510 RepID=A0A6L2N5V7_TANCI|nr:hypothetical protein [Tanacetum cinerariifolium]